jgi:REP element-mobilizing transposase RayT
MGNTFTNLLYHLVFSTKNRKDFIQDSFRDELYSYLGGIVRGEKGKTITIGGTKDHMHILAKFPQGVTVSNMLQNIKGNSSKWLNEKGFVAYRFYWQRGYGAFTVSESMVDIVSRYIENQEIHHKKMTFKEEFLMLLKRNNIEYNEKYLWD